MISSSWEDMAFQITVITASGVISNVVIKLINDYMDNKKSYKIMDLRS